MRARTVALEGDKEGLASEVHGQKRKARDARAPNRPRRDGSLGVHRLGCADGIGAGDVTRGDLRA